MGAEKATRAGRGLVDAVHAALEADAKVVEAMQRKYAEAAAAPRLDATE